MQENYQPPAKKPIKFFSGQGQRLGTTSTTDSSVSFPGAFPASVTAPPVPAAVQPVTLDVNHNAPVTQIQMRLADGTRYLNLTN
jgi:UBX domain-containing protein 1